MKVSTVLIARMLALLWAVFWLFFFVAESVVYNTPALGLAVWTGAGLLFVTLALLPWRNEKAGGQLLMAAGLLLAPAYLIWGPRGLPLASRITTAVVFSAPPLVAGWLFLTHRRKPKE